MDDRINTLTRGNRNSRNMHSKGFWKAIDRAIDSTSTYL
jgi:hypothetical protein